MTESRQCPKCSSLNIGHFDTVSDYDMASLQRSQKPRPSAVSAISNRAIFVLDWLPQGELEAYLCTDCGYYEQYVKDVQAPPYDKLEGFTWVNPEHTQEGPYR